MAPTSDVDSFKPFSHIRCLAAGCLGILLVLVHPARVESDHTPSKIELKQVVEAWRKRSINSKYLDIVVTGHQYAPRKEYTKAMLAAENGDTSQPFVAPEKTFPVKIHFSLGSGGLARVEHEGQILSVQDRDYVSRYSIDVFDGSVRKSFIGPSFIKFPSAHIRKGGTADVAMDMRTTPILLIYRAVDGVLAQFDPANLVLTEELGVVDGRECNLLRDGESMLWLDPARDFLPTRYHQYSRGKLRQSIDIKYRNHDKFGLVPSGWTNALFFGADRMLSSVTVTVLEVRVGEPLPADFFNIPLPDGTWVQNYITDETHILRNGGQQRPVMPGEFDGKNYEQLLHSDPPGKGGRWWFIAILAAGALLVILLLRRYYHARRSVTPPTP